jgi:heme-degrading monooxygenase HmoA
MTILEIAEFQVGAGQAAEFEAVLERAGRVIAQANGYLGHRWHRSVDHAGKYVALIEWRTREHHVQGFRESPLFAEWRAILGPYFATPPVVDHCERIG